MARSRWRRPWVTKICLILAIVMLALMALHVRPRLPRGRFDNEHGMEILPQITDSDFPAKASTVKSLPRESLAILKGRKRQKEHVTRVSARQGEEEEEDSHGKDPSLVLPLNTTGGEKYETLVSSLNFIFSPPSPSILSLPPSSPPSLSPLLPGQNETTLKMTSAAMTEAFPRKRNRQKKKRKFRKTLSLSEKRALWEAAMARRKEKQMAHERKTKYQKKLFSLSRFWTAMGEERIKAGLALEDSESNEGGEGSEEGVDATWQSPYVSDEEIDVLGTPICQDFLKTKGFEQNDTLPITRVHHLKREGLRTLVFLPRFGLGNTLRGYVSSFIYAKLTGRRLVRFHGGSHTNVFDGLCDALKCGFDAIHWEFYGTPKKAWDVLYKEQPASLMSSGSKSLFDSLLWSVPIVITNAANTFDGYWLRRKKLSKCVYQSFKCRDLWCVYSRAMHKLVGNGPKKLLINAIKENIGRQPFPEKVPSEIPEEEAQIGVSFTFDIAVHVRTRSNQVEVVTCKTKACQEETKQMELKFTDNSMWDCVSTIIEENRNHLPFDRRKALRRRKLNVFLATDNEALRPIIAKKLQFFGDVYCSTGRVVHTSKSGPKVSGLATMAEFYLMSKAHILLETNDYVSTFAYFSGISGNATLLAMVARSKCRFRVDHVGTIVTPSE